MKLSRVAQGPALFRPSCETLSGQPLGRETPTGRRRPGIRTPPRAVCGGAAAALWRPQLAAEDMGTRRPTRVPAPVGRERPRLVRAPWHPRGAYSQGLAPPRCSSCSGLGARVRAGANQSLGPWRRAVLSGLRGPSSALGARLRVVVAEAVVAAQRLAGEGRTGAPCPSSAAAQSGRGVACRSPRGHREGNSWGGSEAR